MIVEKPKPPSFPLRLNAAHGLGVLVGAVIPLATAALYDHGLAKELARQTALRLDARCNPGAPGMGPWTADCRQAAAALSARRVAGWLGRD